MDHHQSWIIIIIAPAILSKWCYLSILLVIGSSTEPSLFHVGCRPSLHVGLHLLQHLYLNMGGTHPAIISERPNTHIWPWEAQPATLSEWPITYIRPWEEHIPQPCRKGSTLISNHGRNTSCNHVRMAQHSHLTMGVTHPKTMSEWTSTYIRPWEEHIPQPCWKGSALTSDHGRNTSRNHVRMA